MDGRSAACLEVRSAWFVQQLVLQRFAVTACPVHPCKSIRTTAGRANWDRGGGRSPRMYLLLRGGRSPCCSRGRLAMRFAAREA